jgi:hypothetical protein
VPPAFAQEDVSPIVRTSLEPDGPVTVGQPVRLIVEVLVPTWFTGAPRYPQIDLADAIVIFQERGFNFSDRVNGETFAGQRRQYLIYPTRPGTVTISGEEVILSYAVDARPSPPAPYGIPDVRIEATVPEDAEGLDYFFAATAFSLEDRFNRARDGLKVGDSLTRTITMTADDAFAMMIPSLNFEPIAGLAVYPEQPELNDEGGQRGETRVGSRVESVTYLMQEKGEYRLPKVEVSWWDSRTKRMRRESLPEVGFTVAPNPSLNEEIPLPPDDVEDSETETDGSALNWRDVARRWAGPIAGIVLLAWVVVRLMKKYLPRYRARREEERRRRESSEAFFFERFKRAGVSGNPSATFRELMFWLDRFESKPGVATLRGFVSSVRDRQLVKQARQLSDALFARRAQDVEGPWSGARMVKSVARTRKARLAEAQKDMSSDGELPPLNPGR